MAVRRRKKKLPAASADPKPLSLAEYEAAIVDVASLDTALEQRTAFPDGGLGGVITTGIRQQPAGDERCISYAVAGAMETFWCRKLGSSQEVPFVAVHDIFRRAGTSMTGAVQAVAAGVLDEVVWPSPMQPVGPNPQLHTWRATLRPVLGPSEQRRESMCRALTMRGALVITIRIFENFARFTDPQNATAYRAAGPATGAHTMCVVGFERNGASGVWLVKNSYGPNWGYNGFGRIPWGDTALGSELMAYDVVSVVR